MSALDRAIARVLRETDRRLFGRHPRRVLERWSDEARAASLAVRRARANARAKTKGQHSVTGLGKGVKGFKKRDQLAGLVRSERLQQRFLTSPIVKGRAGVAGLRQMFADDRRRERQRLQWEHRNEIGRGFYQDFTFRRPSRFDEDRRRPHWRDLAGMVGRTTSRGSIQMEPQHRAWMQIDPRLVTPGEKPVKKSRTDIRFETARNTAAAQAYAAGDYARAELLKHRQRKRRRSA